jgi:y4mF family transcriptional regulator
MTEAPIGDNSTVASVLGRQIRDRRRQLGLSQLEAAELAGVSVRFLGVLERGKPTVRLNALLAVSETLGLKVTLS